jgi:hypothetical protein
MSSDHEQSVVTDGRQERTYFREAMPGLHPPVLIVFKDDSRMLIHQQLARTREDRSFESLNVDLYERHLDQMFLVERRAGYINRSHTGCSLEARQPFVVPRDYVVQNYTTDEVANGRRPRLNLALRV